MKKTSMMMQIRLECGRCQGKEGPARPCRSQTCWLAEGALGTPKQKIERYRRFMVDSDTQKNRTETGQISTQPGRVRVRVGVRAQNG